MQCFRSTKTWIQLTMWFLLKILSYGFLMSKWQKSVLSFSSPLSQCQWFFHIRRSCWRTHSRSTWCSTGNPPGGHTLVQDICIYQYQLSSVINYMLLEESSHEQETFGCRYLCPARLSSHWWQNIASNSRSRLSCFLRKIFSYCQNISDMISIKVHYMCYE